jgi:putative transposase
VNRLEELGFQISMSRKGAPWENGRAESFIKTLKAEEVSLKPYRHITEARRSMGRFLEDVYNQRRLHSALGYLAPVAFEAHFAAQPQAQLQRRPLRGSFPNEFSEAWGNLSIR